MVGNGWAFIHIPKCGGSAVRGVLKGREVSDFLPMDRPTVSHRFHWLANERPEGKVFAFIRHPASWLRSYWAMRLKERRLDTRKPLDRLWSPDLDKFVQAVCRSEPGYVPELFRAYTQHYPNTLVYRLEHGIGKALSAVLGATVRVPVRNPGNKAPLSPESLAAVEETQCVS